MKQRISAHQLDKLSDAQKERLREWWTPHYGDAYYCNRGWSGIVEEYDPTDSVISSSDGSYSAEKSESLPELSIGQMIQFIQEKKQLKGMSKNRFNKWFVNIDTAMLGYKDELCDSLWETTVQLLKSA